MSSSEHPARSHPLLPATAILLASLVGAASAGGSGSGDYGPLPPIGSGNVSIADPLVTRPSTTPCEVPLFDDLSFSNFDPQAFDYVPPAECAGPWSKVVLSADFSVTAGVQFDRTAKLWLGGVNLYFGTTAEPSPSLAPSWHVERDLTGYSALLAAAQTGRILIENPVDSTYTGVIHASAKLQFYPVPAGDTAPAVADQVLPLGSDPLGATVELATSTDMLSKTLSLPTNIERAYLDLYAESQGSDEFWWTCMPDDVAPITNDCPGTAFREVEISVDGQPAGVAPVYPWVYTGGFQPRLWMPIPGVQTLNFEPYRIDLTPFAGLLSDGSTHTLSLSVFNTHDRFSTTATLLLHLDAGTSQVTGAVTTNTIGAGPEPVVNSTIGSDGIGAVTVTSNRQFTLAGYVETSHGRVDTQVEQTLAFNTTTTYTSTTWNIVQDTSVDATTTITSETPASTRVEHEQRDYPFSMNYVFGSSPNTIDFDQRFDRDVSISTDAVQDFSGTLGNHVGTHYQSAAASRHSTQEYHYSDSTGACYSRDLTSVGNQLATVTDAAACIAADTIFADGFDPAS